MKKVEKEINQLLLGFAEKQRLRMALLALNLYPKFSYLSDISSAEPSRERFVTWASLSSWDGSPGAVLRLRRVSRMGQDDQAVSELKRPAYQTRRFDEDWSVLKGVDEVRQATSGCP